MGNNYKNEQSNIENMITKLHQNITDYTAKVEELISLMNEIKDSSEWVDGELKPTFINTYQSYIDTYKKIIESLNKNMVFLEKKSGALASLNQAYIRRS